MSARLRPPDGAWSIVQRVYFYDTDAGGVVHNIAYLRMIETARTEFAAHHGWMVQQMLEGSSDGCPVVARTEIDYIKPARLGDELCIEAWIEKVERVRFIVSFFVTRSGDQAVICQARQTMVPVDLKSGRPVPLREDWRRKFAVD